MQVEVRNVTMYLPAESNFNTFIIMDGVNSKLHHYTYVQYLLKENNLSIYCFFIYKFNIYLFLQFNSNFQMSQISWAQVGTVRVGLTQSLISIQGVSKVLHHPI